jgi:hypothetical protein
MSKAASKLVVPWIFLATTASAFAADVVVSGAPLEDSTPDAGHRVVPGGPLMTPN